MKRFLEKQYHAIVHSALLLVILSMAIVMISISGCSRIPSTEPYLAEDRTIRWENDIDYLIKTLPKVHKNLFFSLSEEDFMRELTNLKQKIPEYNDTQLEIALNVILAGVKDTHTGSSVSFETQYPLELDWFSDGIYITGADAAHEELLNSRIVSLNGIPAESAAEKLKPLLAGANESWFKNQVVYYLVYPDILNYFAVTESVDLELEVQLVDGRVKQVQISPIDYRELVMLSNDPEDVALYRSQPDKNYWYEYLEDSATMYFNYSSCSEMRDLPFEIFSREFWSAVETYQPERLIIDIRQNRGGSSPILEPFIRKVKKSDFNQAGKLYVITGTDTFSSAVLNALRLRSDTAAVFVGEATGGEPNHYGEVKKFKLPNSEITIRYSTKYFKWLDEDVNTLEPDQIITESFSVYMAGRDPVLEWILEQQQSGK